MAQDQQYLTFGVDRETFGIPVDLVKEILDPGPISRLPRAPAYLLGLMDVRGASMPIIDLRIKFGLEPIQIGPRTRIIHLRELGRGARGRRFYRRLRLRGHRPRRPRS